MKRTKLMLGDNIESLRKLPDNSIDSVVTDPPYGLSFMNKKWDHQVPSVEFWEEVYRILKPGGHILSFGGTRTYHRMVVNIEDAGFEIRDQIMWLYGSGFPKSHNIGKAVDKKLGNEREVVGIEKGAGSNKFTDGINGLKPEYENTKGNTPYEGWGTALKPANEPICLARKPLSESVAENVLKWGTGGINIDGCRIGTDIIKSMGTEGKQKFRVGDNNKVVELGAHEGRFPANLILECCCDEVIKGEKGEVKTGSGRDRSKHDYNSVGNFGSNDVKNGSKRSISYAPDNYNDKGDIHTNPECPCYQLDSQSKSSHFFYQAKVNKKERNLGLDGFEEKKLHNINQLDDRLRPDGTLRETPVHKNNHPTVKPVSLMTYLCRLVTPEGGIVLDPFMGSGSTGIAALLEGFRFVGMEMDKEYFKIAESRIENYEQYREFLKK